MRLTRLAVALLLTVAAPLAAQQRAADSYDLGPERLALKGYDPVAYFDEGGGRPQRGKAELSLEHEGVVYRFASEADRTAFAADPAHYEPAHGGWCSYAMSLGKKVASDPTAFRVSEGRLLLFASKDSMQVDSAWVEDEPAALARADKQWKGLSGEEPRRAPPGSWRPYREFNLSGASLAIEGYDPVSYFPEGGGKPQKGSAQFELRHQGVLYRFASAAHRDAFAADPTRFEPAHGGWCSYAMGAKNDRVEVDPLDYRLTDGHLHLFFNAWYSDTRDDWDADTAALKRKADANWQKQLEAARRSDRKDGKG